MKAPGHDDEQPMKPNASTFYFSVVQKTEIAPISLNQSSSV
jgi:hypothetical protein